MAPTLMTTPRMLRRAMGKSLGDAAFFMQPGDIRLIEQDPVLYPAGFEIILCLQRDERSEEEVQKDLRRPMEKPTGESGG
jgi:hypothetical protein